MEAGGSRVGGEVASLARKLITAVRILHHLEMFEDNSGHVSVRIPGTSRFVVLGHLHDAGTGLDEVTEDELIEVDAATGDARGRLEPPGEVYIHTAIYRARSDVGAVVHCHPVFPVALSLADRPVLPVHHWASALAPSVPIYPDHRQVDTPERGERLARTLADGYAVVLRGHGIVAVGANVEEATTHAIVLDRSARLQALAAQVGPVRPLPIVARGPVSPERAAKLWAYYAARVSPHGGAAG